MKDFGKQRYWAIERNLGKGGAWYLTGAYAGPVWVHLTRTEAREHARELRKNVKRIDGTSRHRVVELVVKK